MKSRDTYPISAARESDLEYVTFQHSRGTHTRFRRRVSHSQGMSRLPLRHTHVRNYAVVESWGADEGTAAAYIHIESRTRVENGVTVSDEIWSRVYEPE